MSESSSSLLARLRIAEQAAVADETLSVLRHDLRNKLAAARQAGMYLATKSRGTELWKSEPRIERFFGIIDGELDAADRMLTEHEGLVRLYARTPSIFAATCALDAAVGVANVPESCELVRATIDDRLVEADLAELALALRCLIDNAVEAIGPGRSGRITVGGEAREGSCVFFVADDGPGLDADHFRRMVRPLATTRAGARGLGLAIAKRVADRYGGSLGLGAARGPGVVVELAVSLSEAVA